MRVRVALLAELPEGKGKAIEASGHALVLFRVGSRVHAVRDRCPHAGAPLSIGRLQGTELTCAWHGWTFDVTTGESIPHNPAFDAATYPVTIDDDGVWVDLPETLLHD